MTATPPPALRLFPVTMPQHPPTQTAYPVDKECQCRNGASSSNGPRRFPSSHPPAPDKTPADRWVTTVEPAGGNHTKPAQAGSLLSFLNHLLAARHSKLGAENTGTKP